MEVCYSESRRRKRWKSDVPLQPTDGRAIPDSLLTLAERDRIERGLSRISAEHRAVLALHYYLDVPAGTVRSRIRRAHQTLRSALEADSRQVSPSLSPEAME